MKYKEPVLDGMKSVFYVLGQSKLHNVDIFYDREIVIIVNRDYKKNDKLEHFLDKCNFAAWLKHSTHRCCGLTKIYTLSNPLRN